MFYYIDPEVTGGWGDNIIVDTSIDQSWIMIWKVLFANSLDLI